MRTFITAGRANAQPSMNRKATSLVVVFVVVGSKPNSEILKMAKEQIIEVHREGIKTETISRMMCKGDVAFDGKWFPVQFSGQDKFIEVGPVPPPRPEVRPRYNHNLALAMMLTLASDLGNRLTR